VERLPAAAGGTMLGRETPAAEGVMEQVRGAVRRAQAAAEGGAADLATALAERVGARAGVAAIFGAPVERDGVTVVPVGASRWMFGGGGGHGRRAGEEGEGSGGGGAATVTPIGYIEVTGAGARFRRIGPSLTPATLVAGAAAVAVILRSLRALLR
jgi:uncharacterized spore protein YtfJ